MDLAKFTGALLNRLRNRPSGSEEDARHVLGRAGETAAARHLSRNGYRVIYRNFRAPRGGEVDLVCRELATATLVFVEVKTRRSRDHGTPGQAVTREKQHLIAKGALTWLRLLDNPDVRVRFDVVEVDVSSARPQCTVLKNAFPLPDPYLY